MTLSLAEAHAKRLEAEDTFLKTPTDEMVDPSAIKRGAFLSGLGEGAGKGAMYAGIGVVALAGLALAAVVGAGFGVTLLAGVAAYAGMIPLGTMAMYGAGAIALGAVIGGVTGAGKAMSESDDMVKAEVDRVERKKQLIANRQMQRREMALRFEQQEVEFQKQSQALGMGAGVGSPLLGFASPHTAREMG